MRRLGVVGVVVVASLVVGACAKQEEPLGPTATVPQATTTSDPYAVPSVIDEAYVNRVLALFDQVLGDVARLVVSTKSIPFEATERLRAIYLDDFLQLRIDLLHEDIRIGFVNYAAVPGNPTSTVTEILSTNDHCVFAEIARDYSQVAAVPSGVPNLQWVALERTARPPDALNPTPWILAYDGFEPGRQKPTDPCVD